MGKPLSSLSLRIISSAVLIPIVVCIVAIGEEIFMGLIAICLAIGFMEWINIARHISMSRAAKFALIALGLVYLSVSFVEMIALREHTNGLFLTVMFMLCIWASDSVAYLFGKTIGGKKMSPTISPNKTWSGYAGALIGPALVTSIGMPIYFKWYLYFDQEIPFDVVYILAGLAIGIAGQSGDLMISAMKRKAGLKDTGAIIPGHGGILDRIDALLLALPVFLALIKYTSLQIAAQVVLPQ